MMHRAREVGLRHSSCETDEQSVALCCGAIHSRAIRCGAGGAKGGDQEDCGPAKHVRDAGPDKRVTGAGAHTAIICRHTPEVGAVCGKARTYGSGAARLAAILAGESPANRGVQSLL